MGVYVIIIYSYIKYGVGNMMVQQCHWHLKVPSLTCVRFFMFFESPYGFPLVSLVSSHLQKHAERWISGYYKLLIGVNLCVWCLMVPSNPSQGIRFLLSSHLKQIISTTMYHCSYCRWISSMIKLGTVELWENTTNSVVPKGKEVNQ